MTETLHSFRAVAEEFKRFKFQQPGWVMKIYPLDPMLYGLDQYDADREPGFEQHDPGFIVSILIDTYDTYSYREPTMGTADRDVVMPAWQGMSVTTVTVPRIDYERDRLNEKIKIEHRKIFPLPIPRDALFPYLRHAIHAAAVHEADEWIRVDGEMVYDPHKAEKR
jgi:hypothetical protein